MRAVTRQIAKPRQPHRAIQKRRKIQHSERKFPRPSTLGASRKYTFHRERLRSICCNNRFNILSQSLILAKIIFRRKQYLLGFFSGKYISLYAILRQISFFSFVFSSRFSRPFPLVPAVASTFRVKRARLKSQPHTRARASCRAGHDNGARYGRYGLVYTRIYTHSTAS